MSGSIEERMITLQEKKAALGKGAMAKLTAREARKLRMGHVRSLFDLPLPSDDNEEFLENDQDVINAIQNSPGTRRVTETSVNNSSADTIDPAGNNQVDSSAETVEPDANEGNNFSDGEGGRAKTPVILNDE